MDRKLRVLVVDDSVVMRRAVSDAISSDPELEVAGRAANGEIALSLCNRLHPDLITLDIEMPVMDGLATLKALRAARCNLPVIVFSTLTEVGAKATVECLASGASDYVAKPADAVGPSLARDRIREVLVPRIKALCRAPETQRTTPASAIGTLPEVSHRSSAGSMDVVAIGCSTGGPNALAEVLTKLPADFPVPVLVVQHMPPAFTHFLAQRLAALCRLPVAEGQEGEALAPGKIWIAPGGSHMCVTQSGGQMRLQLSQAPAENSCRPSVDVLFRSVAIAFSGRALAIVLTGMGQDGLRGCELLADRGAEIWVQDEATSVVWGMPGFVARSGLAQAILPISEIGARMANRFISSRRDTHAAAFEQGVR
jgi:two-component system, chemotaxis family, protein-glutamate methylesterase/glutaminase